jgi:hypothetical protein
MSHPLVVHCMKEKFDVYVGRKQKNFPEGSKWGNPFYLSDESKREEVLDKYINWLMTKDELLNQIHELKGKKLGCWCAPKLCHAEILAKLANDEELE